MPATVEIDEYNGGTTETNATRTHTITNVNYVTTDAHSQVASDYPITPVANVYTGSYKKYHKLHVTSLSTVTSVKNIKFWRAQGSPTSGDLHRTTATMSGYSSQVYATPTTALMTHYVVESSEPATANVGINSSLTGEITSLGVNSASDFVVHQIQVSAATTQGAVMTVRWSYDEIS